MQAEMCHLGEMLRKQREEKGISLKDVENGTSIRMNHLQAIEEGQVSHLISPVYAQGFIKKYAAFLDVDGEQLIKDHPQFLNFLSEKTRENQECAFLESVEVRGGNMKESKWFPNVLWIGGSALAILTLWFTMRFLGFF